MAFWPLNIDLDQPITSTRKIIPYGFAVYKATNYSAWDHFVNIKYKFVQYGLPLCSITLLLVAVTEYNDFMPLAAAFHLTLSAIALCVVIISHKRDKPQWAMQFFLFCSIAALTGQFFLAPEDQSLPLWMCVFPIILIFTLGFLRGVLLSMLVFAIFTVKLYVYTKATTGTGVDDYIYLNTLIVFVLMIVMAYFYEKVNSEFRIKLDIQAKTDYLTGIHNRRAINGLLKTEIQQMNNHTKPMSILLLDVDHFKSVNDTYGHSVGDEVLRETTQVIQLHIRQADTVARWGGEEFLVLLPQTGMAEAKVVAERIRTAVESSHYKHAGSITISIGVATTSALDDLQLLLKKADSALYRAKSFGRNRIELAVESGEADNLITCRQE